MSYLKLAPLSLSNWKISQKSKNSNIWDQKYLISNLVISGLEFSNSYCHIWNQHPPIFLIAKFIQNIKMSRFGTKNTLFGIFWARTFKNYCHIWNQHPRICDIRVFDPYSELWYRAFFFIKVWDLPFLKVLVRLQVLFITYTLYYIIKPGQTNEGTFMNLFCNLKRDWTIVLNSFSTYCTQTPYYWLKGTGFEWKNKVYFFKAFSWSLFNISYFQNNFLYVMDDFAYSLKSKGVWN